MATETAVALDSNFKLLLMSRILVAVEKMVASCYNRHQAWMCVYCWCPTRAAPSWSPGAARQHPREFDTNNTHTIMFDPLNSRCGPAAKSQHPCLHGIWDRAVRCAVWKHHQVASEKQRLGAFIRNTTQFCSMSKLLNTYQYVALNDSWTVYDYGYRIWVCRCISLNSIIFERWELGE